MRRAARIARIAGTLLGCAGGALVVVGWIGIAYTQGLAALRDHLSPFNIIGWLAVLVTLAPGIGLHLLADRLDRRP